MKALFTGTFNPPTKGHLNIIERAGRFCSLTVGIASNQRKSPPELTPKKSKELLQTLIKNEVVLIEGLVVHFAKEHHFDLLIRGVRNPNEFIKEQEMAQMNREIFNIETLLLPADPSYAYIH
ncbi:MAG: adenylyltransferase/cytidyltransferase family protein, partial [Waddliaceae bacterium]